MKILIYIISLVLLLFHGFCMFLYFVLDGFSLLFTLMTLPAFLLMILLKVYTSNPKTNYIKLYIVLTWLLLIVVSGGFYIALASINWR